MSNGFLVCLKRKVANTNGVQNVMVDMGNFTKHFHILGENLLAVKASVHHQVPHLLVQTRTIMSNGKSQVLIAANRVGVFG